MNHAKLYSHFTCLLLLFLNATLAIKNNKAFAPFVDVVSSSNVNVSQWILNNHVQYLALNLNSNNTNQWTNSSSNITKQMFARIGPKFVAMMIPSISWKIFQI